ARIVKQLQATGSYKHIKKISYSATNVKRYTVSMATLWQAATNGRAKGCTDAIVDRLKHGFSDSVATQVFKGDVVYKLDFEDNVSADVKAEIVKDVSPTIGGKYDSSDSTKIVGTQIRWLAASAPYVPPGYGRAGH